MESRLEKIKSLKVSELGKACSEIRGEIIDAVSTLTGATGLYAKIVV